MIEAVNSVLSSASATRVAAEQQSTARSYAANPEKIQEAAKVPFVSPYIAMDRQYNKAILQIRDSETGDVLRQYPTEGQLKAYRTAQQFTQRQEARQQLQEPVQSSVPSISQSAPDVPKVEAPQANTSDVSVPVAPSVKQDA